MPDRIGTDQVSESAGHTAISRSDRCWEKFPISAPPQTLMGDTWHCLRAQHKKKMASRSEGSVGDSLMENSGL